MKRIFFLFITLLCLAHAGFAQLKVDAAGNTLVSGNIYIGGSSNFLATSGNTPLVFKVNNSVAAGSTGSSGNDNVSFGYSSLSNNTTGGLGNTANGYYTLYSNRTGDYNTANGYYALYSNTSGYENTANGYYALYNNTSGNTNTANGSYALYSNKTSYHNTAIGYKALYSHTSGTGNTANGVYALYSNMTGSSNTAIGYLALYLNTTGSFNTANGISALHYNTTGSQNTAFGYHALFSNVTGNYNTAIGLGADVDAGNLNYATAIGYAAKATASNQVRIGGNTVTSIGGYTAWTNISDGRAKKNIRADVPGLNFINSLQPVTYNLDLDAIDELLKSDDPKINRLKDSLRTARSSQICSAGCRKNS